jgi:hypothetical protein
LEALRELGHAERATRQRLTEMQRAAAERKLAAADELSRVKRYLGNKTTVEAQAKVTEHLAACQAELDSVNSRLKALTTSALPGRVEHALKRLGRGPVAGKVVQFTPRKGEAVADAVARMRAEIAKLRADCWGHQ